METSVLSNEVENKAESMWDEMNVGERAGIRFGVFPHDKIMAAQNEGFDVYQVSVALMRVAKKKQPGVCA